MNSITIDDRDPRIRYSGLWIVAGVGEEYNGTAHGANGAESTATLTFSGIYIGVYGTTGIGDINSYFILDNGTKAPRKYHIGSSPQYRHLLYSSPILADGMHTLVASGSPLWLDYFQITTPDVNVSDAPPALPQSTNVTSPTTAASSSAVLSPASGGVAYNHGSTLPAIPTSSPSTSSLLTPPLPTSSFLTSSLPTSSPTPSFPTSSIPILSLSIPAPPMLPPATPSTGALAKHVSKGPIIGGAIGGVVLILIILAIWYHCRRKRSRTTTLDDTFFSQDTELLRDDYRGLSSNRPLSKTSLTLSNLSAAISFDPSRMVRTRKY